MPLTIKLLKAGETFPSDEKRKDKITNIKMISFHITLNISFIYYLD